MKTGPEDRGTAENESKIAKLENGTRRPPYREKRLWERKTLKRHPAPSFPLKMSPEAQNIKTGPDALGTAKKYSQRAKYENKTRRPRNRRK
jgi:hypothetical protein